MKYYQLVCLISGTLLEEELDTLLGKINGFITEEEGRVNKTEKVKNTKFGYPIKKEERGHRLSFEFFLPAQRLDSLRRKLSSEQQILRFLLLNKILPRKTSTSIKTKRRLPQKRKELKEISDSKKVALKEIDKKIDEILNE